MTRRTARAAVAALALALAAGCAPPPRPPAPTVDDLAARYAAGRARRADAVRALAADLVLRVDGRATGRLPGVSATLLLAVPDRARLRVSSLFGTALDAVARGDSLTAWVPARRTALDLAGAGETLGIAPPVELLARAIGATWQPPAEAWRAAGLDSAGLRLDWLEGGDSLALRLDRAGLPAEVRLAGPAGSVTVGYSAWSRLEGTDWPGALEIADGSGWAKVRVGVTTIRTAREPGSEWFLLRLPDDARRLDWEGLRAWLEQLRGGDE